MGFEISAAGDFLGENFSGGLFLGGKINLGKDFFQSFMWWWR